LIACLWIDVEPNLLLLRPCNAAASASCRRRSHHLLRLLLHDWRGWQTATRVAAVCDWAVGMPAWVPKGRQLAAIRRRRCCC
jgi:hypothetical protein